MKSYVHLTEHDIENMLWMAQKRGACQRACNRIQKLLEKGGVSDILASPECPLWAVWYVVNVLKRRWLEAEAIIWKDARFTYWYVEQVIEGPYPRAEAVILTDVYAAYDYARYILKARWPKAEELFRKDWWFALEYAEHFGFEWPKEGATS